MTNIQKYGGKWTFLEQNKEYSGELHINMDTQIIALELLIPATDYDPMPRPPYKGKIPYISGELFSGAKIVLYGCRTGKQYSRVMSYTQQVIFADFAFWGLKIDLKEELVFSKAVFNFGNIIEWSGLCNYNWNHTNNSSNLEWHKKEDAILEMNENLKIKFCARQGNIGITNVYDNEIIVKQNILVEFSYATSVPWEKILEDVLSIQYFIGLGVNQKVEIYKTQYYHDQIFYEFSSENGFDTKTHVAADVNLGLGNKNITQSKKKYDCLYTLDDAIRIGCFEKWKKNYLNLKPVLDLYFSVLSDTIQTSEMVFLNLVQALETFHARFITDNIREYKSRVDKSIKTFYGTDEHPNAKYWKNVLLDKRQEKHNSIYLRSRLADLIFADGVLPFIGRESSLETYIQKLVDTRNYYTHYDIKKQKNAFSKNELIKINGHLLSLIEFHLLVLIGFDSSEIRQKTIEKINNIDTYYHIHEGTHII